MGLTGLRDFYGSWHLYICRSLFGLSTFLCFTCVYDGHFRLYYQLNSLLKIAMCAYTLYRLISFARYILKSLSIGFRGKKFDIFREHVLCIVPPGWLIQFKYQSSTTLLFVTISRMACLRPDFFSGTAVALLRESYSRIPVT